MMTSSLIALTLLSSPVTVEDEVPAMVLPFAANGVDDWAASEEKPRHVIHVTIDGAIHAGGEVCADDEALDAALEKLAAGMKRAPLFEGGPEAPAEPLLVRADIVADFEVVRRILARGAARSISQYHLAVGDVSKARLDDQGCLPTSVAPQQFLPIVLPLHAGEEQRQTELFARLKTAGKKLEPTRLESRPWSEKEGSRFRWDLASRVLTYGSGPYTTEDRNAFLGRLGGMRRAFAEFPVVLEVGEGVSVAEVINLVDTVRGLGARDVRFR